MTYTASQIIERAMNLADISNSDVISWRENIDYLNDAWKSIYQLMINKGDKNFIREVYLRGTTANGYVSYTLPFDFYEMLSLKNPASGYIYTRHSESEGFNAGSYEIVNNELRVYGVSNRLQLSYWMTPLYLTFPSKTLEFVDFSDQKIISSAGNNVLFADGTIVNVLSHAEVGSIGETAAAEEPTLGNGHVVFTMATQIPDEEGTLVDKILLSYNDYNGQSIDTFYLDKEPTLYRDCSFNIYYEVDDKVYLFGEEIAEPPTLFALDEFPVGRFDHWDDCYLKIENRYVVLHHGRTAEPLDHIHDLRIEVLTSYGPITSNGTVRFVRSWYPETELNFPNNLYFQLLAAELALLYCMKQNISNEGVTQLFQSYRIQYMDSLSNDAGYGRIINVYS